MLFTRVVTRKRTRHGTHHRNHRHRCRLDSDPHLYFQVGGGALRMKNLRSVVIGSAVGGLLGAVAFFAVESWTPITGDAEAWKQKPVPLAISEGGSSNTAEGLQRRPACLVLYLKERDSNRVSANRSLNSLLFHRFQLRDNDASASMTSV